MYPDILGLVCQIGKDGTLEKHNYFGLTKKGNYGLSKCKKSGTKFHEGCFKESFYTSYENSITLFDGLLEVHDYFAIVSTGKEDQKNYNPVENKPTIESVFSTNFDKKRFFKLNVKVVKQLTPETFEIADETGKCTLKGLSSFKYSAKDFEKKNSLNIFNPQIDETNHTLIITGKSLFCPSKHKIEFPKVYSFGYDEESDFVMDGRRKCEGCNNFFFVESFYKHLSHSKKCSSALDEENKKSEVSNMKNLKELDKSKKKIKPTLSSESKVCDGCKKPFTNESLLRHVSHSKKCKSIYGAEKLELMKRDKRCETNSKYYQKNQEQWKKYLPKVRENMKKIRAEERASNIKKSLKDFNAFSNLHVVNCKGCDGSFMSNKILKHISQVDECFSKYGKEDLNLLEKLAKDRKHETETKWREKHLGQVVDQEIYRYDFYKDKIKSSYKKKDISTLPWTERNKLRTEQRKKKEELQSMKWKKAFQKKRIEEAKNKITKYLKGEPLHTSNMNGKNDIQKFLEPWIELFCKKKVTEEMNEEFRRMRNDIEKAWDSFEKEITEEVEKVKIIVSGSIDRNQEKAKEILCRRERMSGEVVDKLDEKIKDFWHILGKEIGKSMKVIGDQIGVKFIYLFEDAVNPKYYWRKRGSKKETFYDESSNDSDSDDLDEFSEDSDPDDPDECCEDTDSTKSEHKDKDTPIKNKPYIRKRKAIDFNINDIDEEDEDDFKSKVKPSVSTRDVPKRKCSKISKSE